MTRPVLPTRVTGTARILSINPANTFVHVHGSVQEMLANDDIGTGVGERPLALEFFDESGLRLTPVFDCGWRVMQLMPTMDLPAPEALLERLNLADAHLREFLKRDTQTLLQSGIEADEVDELLPSLKGLSLGQAFDALGASGDELDPFGEDDNQDWIHAVRHRLGVAH